jgi:hypothetical protein
MPKIKLDIIAGFIMKTISLRSMVLNVSFSISSPDFSE